MCLSLTSHEILWPKWITYCFTNWPIQRNFCLKGQFFPGGDLSSSSKYFFLAKIFLPRGNISSLCKFFLLGETSSSSRKCFLLRGNDLLLAEMIFSLWLWLFPRGNDLFLAKMISSVYISLQDYHALTCTYATKLKYRTIIKSSYES